MINIVQNPRKIGIISTIIGLAISYWQFYLPLQQSTSGEEVVISLELSMIGSLFLFIGVTCTLFGSKALPIVNSPPGQSKAIDYILLATAMTIGAGAYFLLKHVLENRGYIFN